MALQNMRGEFMRRHIEVGEVAAFLKITPECFSHKLDGTAEITVHEAQQIKRRYFPELTLAFLLEEFPTEGTLADCSLTIVSKK